MIVGNGLLARALKTLDSEKRIFFASGVSNSLENRDSEFEREFSLLKEKIENHQDSQFIYFSTLSIHDLSKQYSPYVLHKLQIEDYIKNNCENYLILRIGNVVGNGGNPNTLFNYLKTQIANQNQFVLHKKARRLLIDIDDISAFLSLDSLKISNQTINLSFPYYYNLKEIITAIELGLDLKANFRETEEGDFYKVDFEDQVNAFFAEISPDHYLKILVQKYIQDKDKNA